MTNKTIKVKAHTRATHRADGSKRPVLEEVHVKAYVRKKPKRERHRSYYNY